MDEIETRSTARPPRQPIAGSLLYRYVFILIRTWEINMIYTNFIYYMDEIETRSTARPPRQPIAGSILYRYIFILIRTWEISEINKLFLSYA